MDIIKGRVIGDKRSYKTISRDKVIHKAENPTGTLESIIGPLSARTSYTQDKVDIVLTLPEGGVINASAKNINRYANSIHILRGSSSLNFLQDYPVFANHYLNIVSTHEDGLSPSGYALDAAHDIMKLTIALHALTGGVWGMDKDKTKFSKSDSAEIFVINRSGGGQKGNFKIYFMSDILNKVANNLDLIEIKGYKTGSYNNSRMPPEDAPNIKSAYARIAALLAELHKQQLEITISTKALD